MPEATLGAAFGPNILASARARALVVRLSPLVVGSLLAWAHRWAFSWVSFLLALGGWGLLNLALNLIDDVFDDVSGADAAARADGLSAPTSSGAIFEGSLSRSGAGGFALAFSLIGFVLLGVCGARATQWIPVLALGAFALEAAAKAPGIRYASRATFAFEIAAVAFAGLAPCAAGWAAQTHRIDGIAVHVGVVPGILVMLVLFHQQFLRHRSDFTIGRPSTVSRLGVRGGIVASAAFAAVAAAELVVQLAGGTIPVWAIAVLAGFAPLVVGYRRVAEDPESIHSQLPFLGAAVATATTCNVLLALSLAIERIRT